MSQNTFAPSPFWEKKKILIDELGIFGCKLQKCCPRQLETVYQLGTILPADVLRLGPWYRLHALEWMAFLVY